MKLIDKLIRRLLKVKWKRSKGNWEASVYMMDPGTAVYVIVENWDDKPELHSFRY